MQVYIGIDWSEDKHDVVFMNQAGVDVARITSRTAWMGLCNWRLRAENSA
jgi:hypothetical protein